MVTVRSVGVHKVMALGLLMLVLAGLLIMAIATGTVQSFEVEMFGVDVSTSSLGLFFSGVAAGAGTLIGLALILRAIRSARRHPGIMTAARSTPDPRRKSDDAT